MEKHTTMGIYEEFIAKSRYARYRDDVQRRENWAETVTRYFDYISKHLKSKHDFDITDSLREELQSAVEGFQVMPSMRAIMTAGKALERDNTGSYNCFSGDTEFITSLGIKSFNDFQDGDTVEVMVDSFKPATVRRFGKERLLKLTVQRGARYREEIFTTANHRWIVVNERGHHGRDVITIELQPGQLLKVLPSKVPVLEKMKPCSVGIMHGIVFGDGTAYHGPGESDTIRTQLCGDSTQLASLFTTGRVGEKRGEGVEARQFISGLPWNWKQLPPISANKEYLLGFIMGWFAADGRIGRNGSRPTISNKHLDNMKWLRSAAAVLGILTRQVEGGVRDTTFNPEQQTTMYSVSFAQHTLPSFFFLKDWHAAAFASMKQKDKFFWKVVSVEPTDRVEDVWCVQVPGDERFTLAQGIQTRNCSYLPVDDPKAFDEAMFILMCGTGVGFSVERQYIAKLPEVPERIYDSETLIVVHDSKEGWAKALRQLISLLYSGEAPRWDLSKVRRAGARLKTFGGRASGPEPLNDLFKFVTKTFKAAQGRKLNSLECHDLMCKIGEVVVVGGVRRSAMISLSNLSDDRMRHAKSGAWWETQGQRALANNSACYTERPDVGIFMQEWLSLYESKSGERGIFNREAAKNVVKRSGRRDPDHEFGCNPCCFTADTLVATADGRNAVSIGQLAQESQGEISFPVYSAARSTYHNQAGDTEEFRGWKTEVKMAIAKSTGLKPVVKVTLSNGDVFEATDDHPLATTQGTYVQVKDSIGVPLEGFFVEGTKQYTQSTLPTRIEQVVSPQHHLTQEVFVVAIEPQGVKEIFDLQVEDNHNFFIITRSFDEKAETSRGILVHNSEIILRPYQFCNLTEVIVRSDDTMEDLKRKIRIATIMGTFQSTLTHFPYLRKIWRDNTEQERLLGVSMTGILDNPLLNNPDDPELPARLDELREYAIEVNKLTAERIGITASAAITATKPSGTVSQLCDTASGIHARHAKYYFRRVRNDNKDPLTKAMIDAGVPAEPDVMKPDSTTVFTFPKKAPDGALVRDDLDAIKHLRLWLIYQRHYCEHKPSVTISVTEKEWPAVGAFVWEHFDEMSGVSFLPYDGGSYKQAPYEECTKEEYEALLAKMPTHIDWDSIIEYDDNVEGAQTLSCTAGGCEI